MQYRSPARTGLALAILTLPVAAQRSHRDLPGRRIVRAASTPPGPDQVPSFVQRDEILAALSMDREQLVQARDSLGGMTLPWGPVGI